MPKTIGIFYFSGTGNTEILMHLLENEFLRSGASVDIFRIDDILKDNSNFDTEKYDVIGFGYPIHAFDAPKIVYDFIRKMPRAKSKFTFILKCPADQFIEGGSTAMIKAKLKGRGYELFHEGMILMPSNMLKKYPDELVKQLYYTAIRRVKKYVEEILVGRMRRQQDNAFIKITSWTVSNLEKVGVSIFGKDLKVSKNCTLCGKCIKSCPRSNIRMEAYKVKFGWNCIACLRCIYRCPQMAISPGVHRFVAFKDGYNIQDVIDNPNITGEFVNNQTRGYYKRLYGYIYDRSF